MELSELVNFLNNLLPFDTVEDDSLNGLQIANSGHVDTVAFAVDASLEAVRLAKKHGAAMLFVHHGLFWGHERAITDLHYGRIKAFMNSDIALYASHLPLDIHPEFGNSAQAVRSLGWPAPKDFGLHRGAFVGKQTTFRKAVSLEKLEQTIETVFNCCIHTWNFGKKDIETAAFVSGGGIGLLEQAIEEKVDVMITGEPKHSFYWTAREARLNVLFAGHYATETPGIKAVAEHLQRELNLKTVILELPTGE